MARKPANPTTDINNLVNLFDDSIHELRDTIEVVQANMHRMDPFTGHQIAAVARYAAELATLAALMATVTNQAAELEALEARLIQK